MSLTPPGRALGRLGWLLVALGAALILFVQLDSHGLLPRFGPRPRPQPANVPGDAPALIPDAVVGAGAGLADAAGLAVDSRGNIYAGDRAHGRVVVFSAGGQVLHAWGQRPRPVDAADPAPGELGAISDLAVGKDGALYVLGGTANRVTVFDPTGTVLRTASVPTLLPNGVALAADGSLFIADTGHSRLVQVPALLGPGAPDSAALGGRLRLFDGPATLRFAGFTGPVAVAVTANRLYAADLHNRIVELDAGGAIVQAWPLPVSREHGGSRLAVAPDERHLYLSDPDRARIAVLTPADGSLAYFGHAGTGPGEFQSPNSIATGPDGRVYVLDRVAGAIAIFDLGK